MTNQNSLTTQAYWDRGNNTSGKSYPSPSCRMDYETMEILHPFLQKRTGGSLIELGCGDSYMLPYFAKAYDYHVYGIDYSLQRLHCTARNLDRNGIQGLLQQGDFHNIPKSWGRKFDITYSGGVIEHFRDPVEVLRAFSGYMRRDGLMVTTVPHMKGFWGNIGSRLNREADSGYIRMDLKDVVQCHLDAGLKVIFSTYFRELDCSVLNFAHVPAPLRMLIYGGITTIDIIAKPLYRYQDWLAKHIPESWYTDTITVARR